MLPGDVTERISAVRAALKPETELSFMATTTWPWAWPTALPP